MIVSFFKDWSYIVWANYTHREDCVHVSDVDFDPTNQELALQYSEETWYTVEVNAKILPSEDVSLIKERVKNELTFAEDYTTVYVDNVMFEKSDIWPMIVARFFKWDVNAEMAYLQRWNFLTSLEERTKKEEAELKEIKLWYIAKEEFKNYILSINK